MKLITTLILFAIFYLPFEQSIQSNSRVDSKIIIVDTKESLNEQLKQFDGKIVYIDVWATYCAPCINEFKYKKKVSSFFEKNKILTLCICVDKEKNKEKWKNLIQEHSVKGYHVFIDVDLIEEYKTIVDLSGNEFKYFGRGIPRFLLIGKNGNILEKTAFPPSNKEILIEQLKKYLN